MVQSGSEVSTILSVRVDSLKKENLMKILPGAKRLYRKIKKMLESWNDYCLNLVLNWKRLYRPTNERAI